MLRQKGTEHYLLRLIFDHSEFNWGIDSSSILQYKSELLSPDEDISLIHNDLAVVRDGVTRANRETRLWVGPLPLRSHNQILGPLQ